VSSEDESDAALLAMHEAQCLLEALLGMPVVPQEEDVQLAELERLGRLEEL